jgi:serine/threonine protein kinase
MDNSSLAAGATISHYRIVEKLGAGGMGDVYLPEDTRLHRKVLQPRVAVAATLGTGTVDDDQPQRGCDR